MAAFDTPSIVSFAAAAADAAGHAGKAGQDPGAKAEKARQKLLSARYTNIYVWIMAALLGFLILRNLILTATRFFDRRRRRQAASNEKGRRNGFDAYNDKPALLRWSDKIDSHALKPVRGLPTEWTYLRLVLVTAIVIVNTVFCVVGSTQLHSAQSAGSSIARAFSRRCGRIATANYPILFMFAGRNSVIAKLTGLSYQSLRFYHILLGFIAFIESFVHTIAYIGHYMIWQGKDKLAHEATQKYFKWGIVAVVFMFVNCVFGLKWLRRRSYEVFLLLHVVGAALILTGSWYHRPIMQDWVYAAVAIWVAERVFRGFHHVGSVVGTRFFLRAHLVKARAEVQDGAIKLSVPANGQTWTAGQHVYLSFWGLDLLRRPWLFGWTQSHPFSIANIPSGDMSAFREMRFVLRVHGGLTLELAGHIVRRSEAKDGQAVDCWVSVEGPHGSPPPAAEFDTLLLIAGGSGITHPLSVAAAVCRRAAAGQAVVTSKIKLVWALHRLEQAAWVQETLEETRRWAEKANLELSVSLCATRTASAITSGASSPSSGANLEEEKKENYGEAVNKGGKCREYSGRPDVHDEVAKAVSDSPGRTLIIACGPEALANEVAKASTPYLSSDVKVDIARFEC
ncbi:ferric-chelate reductase [Rhodotorula toruloides]